MIIQLTDFIDRPYKVPNQHESGDLTAFLTAQEIELAVNYLLGYELWTEFKEALEADGSIDTKWINLRDGADYVNNDKNYHYNGWVDLIRPALYANWMIEGTFKFTNVGWIINNPNSAPQGGGQSSMAEDQYEFHVRYWNEFVSKIGNSANGCYNYNNSFYGFMNAANEDEEVYENWILNVPQPKNRFNF